MKRNKRHFPSPRDLERQKLAAERALQIIGDVIKEITKPISERQIFALFKKHFALKPKWFAPAGVIKEELAWEDESCPIVLSGESLGDNSMNGVHATASKRILKPGNTCVFDFGVRLFFEDGVYCSDLQRVIYALHKGEKEAPKETLRRFETVVKAIEIGRQNLIPGRPGKAVDRPTRRAITSAGYPSYGHGTGHSVAQICHDRETRLNAKSRRAIKEGHVYTIEPRIALADGISIEEMVIARPSGGEFLVPPQRKLIYVKIT